IDCLKALGADITAKEDKVYIKGITDIKASDILRCNECGSTLRFFIAICLLGKSEITLSGSTRLMERPLDIYEKMCKEQNLLFNKEDINLLKIKGPLKSGTYNIDGSVSSQFISGLLFALPLLDGDSRIVIEGHLESKPYINMTIKALKAFKVIAVWENDNTIFVKGNQSYEANDLSVEGDWSNAAFFLALGDKVKVNGLDYNSLQGDKICEEYYKKLSEGNVTLDISDCPDLGPVLFSYAGLHNGATFTGTNRLKIKESDRILSMKEELIKFGIDVIEGDNEVTITKTKLQKPKEVLESHNDHRITMALSTILVITGGSIDGAECISKSMPDFFEKLKKLGADVEII
nr:3-phosphoshikimate 1-carboxyvinyltransferase [Lachnospiraceae bacterium]